MAFPSSGSWHLVFADDYAYANQTAFENAYDDPFLLDPTSVDYVNWGATNGPTGGNGVEAQDTGNDHVPSGDPATGSFKKGMLVLDGEEFRVHGIYDNAQEYGWLAFQWYKSDGSDSETLVALKAGKEVTGSDYGDLTVQVWTASGYGNITSTLYQEHLVGVVPSGDVHTWEIQTRFTTVAADGYARVLIDGVEVFLFEGPVQRGAATTINAVEVRPGGKFGSLRIYDTTDGIIGSMVAGVTTTVTATRAIAFGLDGAVNVHDTVGTFKVFGDAVITGALTVGGDTIAGGAAGLSALLDALGT